MGPDALALRCRSPRGLDRDRAVDETGGQIAVFGRLGSRPFTRQEMERLFLNANGVPFKVSDDVDMKAWKAGTVIWQDALETAAYSSHPKRSEPRSGPDPCDRSILAIDMWPDGGAGSSLSGVSSK